jgi:hypothetical protein
MPPQPALLAERVQRYRPPHPGGFRFWQHRTDFAFSHARSPGRRPKVAQDVDRQPAILRRQDNLSDERPYPIAVLSSRLDGVARRSEK